LPNANADSALNWYVLFRLVSVTMGTSVATMELGTPDMFEI